MTNRAIRRVGIVGLGKMGLPMARHLRKGGFEVAGCDVNDAARKQAAAQGVAVVGSPRDVAAAADFVIVVVGFDSEAEQVMLRDDGIAAGAKPGLIVGIASTVAPRTMNKLAAKLDGSGIVLLDMPITRGEWAAEAAKLLTMVGGDAAAYEACRPALQCFADSIFHVGDLGAGQVGKMVNNLILWACISANHEGFRLAERLGVDKERLREALLQAAVPELHPGRQRNAGAERSTSPVPSEGTKVSTLAPASDTAERISAWSRSLDRRITNRVLHWEMMVGSISAGRWVTRPRKTPYLRPSLAMRDKRAAGRAETDGFGRPAHSDAPPRRRTERRPRRRSTGRNRTPCGTAPTPPNRPPRRESPRAA
jgi:3-hydroxyisobutyrate dehydrogenase-like beta-hydroxyacid dehydrogenase